MAWIEGRVSLSVTVMEEMIGLPVKEEPEVIQWYMGELTGNALLARAGHLAAKKKRILADRTLNATETVQKVKPLSKALRAATKRLRQIPGGSEPPGEEDDEGEDQGLVSSAPLHSDQGLVSSAVKKWMKRMVQTTRVKAEPRTTRRRLPLTPRTTPQPSRIPLFTASPPTPPRDTGTRPKTVPKKKKKSWISGLTSAMLEGGLKGIKSGTRSGKGYQTGHGWEEW